MRSYVFENQHMPMPAAVLVEFDFFSNGKPNVIRWYHSNHDSIDIFTCER